MVCQMRGLAASLIIGVGLIFATPTFGQEPKTPSDQRASCVGYAGLAGMSVLRFISAYDNTDARKMQEEVDNVDSIVWALSLRPECLSEHVAVHMILELLTRLNRSLR